MIKKHDGVQKISDIEKPAPTKEENWNWAEEGKKDAPKVALGV